MNLCLIQLTSRFALNIILTSSDVQPPLSSILCTLCLVVVTLNHIFKSLSRIVQFLSEVKELTKHFPNDLFSSQSKEELLRVFPFHRLCNLTCNHSVHRKFFISFNQHLELNRRYTIYILLVCSRGAIKI